MSEKKLGYADKAKELGTHANALVALHLSRPEEFDKEWLVNKLVDQYKTLGLDIDNQKLDK